MPVRYRVPQGSVLGPQLFSMNLAPVGRIEFSFDIDFHCYTDDMQLYLPVVVGEGSCSDKLTACLSAARTWVSSNLLLLNAAS